MHSTMLPLRIKHEIQSPSNNYMKSKDYLNTDEYLLKKIKRLSSLNWYVHRDYNFKKEECLKNLRKLMQVTVDSIV